MLVMLGCKTKTFNNLDINQIKPNSYIKTNKTNHSGNVAFEAED